MSTLEKWLTGMTAVAVAGTIFTSPYSATIFDKVLRGIGGVYTAAKH